jgi:hypothetical protein
MNILINEHQPHVDGSFEMEFALAGQDEHGLPLLDVNMYPTVEGMTGDNFAWGLDGQHLVAGLTIPLEDTGLGTSELESLPLRGGWATISAEHGPGFSSQELEGVFGRRVAVVVLEALADALLSESIMPIRTATRTDLWNWSTKTGMRRFLLCTRTSRVAS